MKKHIKYFYIILLIFVTNSCIEPFDFKSEAYESKLVVSCIITNQLKKHTIKLSQTTPIDITDIEPEKNAIVEIVNDLGTTYSFQEHEDGEYISTEEFAAQANRSYTLKIKTEEGKSYVSSNEKLPMMSEIEDVNFTVEQNEIDNLQEVVFRVNSSSSDGPGNYYRYEYDETYKIKSPLWGRYKIVVISSVFPYEFNDVLKDPEVDGTGVCYGNKSSKAIMLTETKTLSQDKVTNYPIRSIPLDNYIIGLRYSILINQYVINESTYNFYSLLNKFSNTGNIFSQVQTGNIPSNIVSESNPSNDEVIGFFEVSSLNTKRVFFDRSDITETSYTNYVEPLTCGEKIQPLISDPSGYSPLLNFLNTGWILAHRDLNFPPSAIRPFVLMKKECGDCSDFGSITQPDFWIE